MKNFWQKLDRGARIGLMAGVVCIVLFMVASVVWVTQSHREVVFSNLSPQDAAAMVAELDRMKVPYSLDAGGTTILVDRDLVHKTRMKLMGRDLPLNGAVGFELFNHADFSMTEFAQKVNYQRALQGEITRTILSIEQIKSARVHLALPEEGLFKRSTQKPKASVTLGLKPGQSLRAEQVTGIQRLVGAAVPGIAAQDVTIVDQQGVALTRSSEPAEAVETGGRLELKKEMETYLARKAGEVLNRSVGPGQALASVDVTLNMDQVKTTTEEVIAAPGRSNGVPTGVVVKERESLRDAAAPLEGAAKGGSSSQREVDYQVGRRVEQVVAQPGSVRRIALVAVVNTKLDDAKIESLKAALAAAVGASFERGDTVVVTPLAAPIQAPVATQTEPMMERTQAAAKLEPDDANVWVLGALALLAAGLAVGFGVASVLGRGHAGQGAQGGLNQAQREVLLSRVNQWLDGAAAATPEKQDKA